LAVSLAGKCGGEEMWRALPVLADVLHQAGRAADARRLFREAEAIQRTIEPENRFLYSVRGFRYHDLLLSGCERYAWVQQVGIGSWAASAKARLARLRSRAKEVERRVLTNRDGLGHRLGRLSNALDEITISRAGLYQMLSSLLGGSVSPEMALRTALGRVETAVEALRSCCAQHHLPNALFTRAWVRLLHGDPAGAQSDLDEAWDIAERGPMQLHMADIHLHRARLFFREEHYPWESPQADLVAAEKLIEDCGYYRRDGELADAKRAILGE
jgi:hypothetical protein